MGTYQDCTVNQYIKETFEVPATSWDEMCCKTKALSTSWGVPWYLRFNEQREIAREMLKRMVLNKIDHKCGNVLISSYNFYCDEDGERFVDVCYKDYTKYSCKKKQPIQAETCN